MISSQDSTVLADGTEAPILRAVQAGDAARVRELLAADPALLQATYRHQDARGESLLHVAVAGDGRPETLEYLAVLDALLESGADVDATGYPDNNEGATALIYCAWSNKPLTVRRLLERGARLEVTDQRGRRAIDRAARPDRRAIFEMLVRAGASYTVHHAARAGAADRVAILLERYPHLVEQADDDGLHPLHHAVTSPQVVRLLLGRRAQVDAVDGTGRTALHHALENACANAPETIGELGPCVGLLQQHGAVVDLFCAIALRDEGRAEAILRDDAAQASAAFAEGSTPLLWASRFGRPGLAARLLELGADPNAYSDHVWMDSTPLAAAARGGHYRICELLLERGADVNRPNHLGKTPLELAMRWGHDDVVRLLQEHGAAI